jgi:repressor LexA
MKGLIKMTVSERIFAMMDERGLTKYQVAQGSGVPASSLTDWSRRGMEPSAAAVVKVAEFLRVPVGYFYGDQDKQDYTERSVRIPVLGRVQAGLPLEAIENVDGWEEIPAEWTTGGREYFALKVNGLSMWPDYIDGETLIVRKQASCESGKDAVALIERSDSTFKRAYFEHDGIRLHPLNPSFKDMFYSAHQVAHLPVEIIGVVVQSRRER